jgi:hypothetical protein
VVSGLVTNAVVHPRTPVRVRIEEVSLCVKLTVHDQSADLPVQNLADRKADDDESGRGLGIVDACGAEWGTELAGDEGKCTWALCGPGPHGCTTRSCGQMSSERASPRGLGTLPRQGSDVGQDISVRMAARRAVPHHDVGIGVRHPERLAHGPLNGEPSKVQGRVAGASGALHP